MKKISIGVGLIGIFFILQGVAGLFQTSGYHHLTAIIVLSILNRLWLIYVGMSLLMLSRYAPLFAIATYSFYCFSEALQIILTSSRIINESYTISEMFIMLIFSILILIGLIIFFNRPKVKDQFREYQSKKISITLMEENMGDIMALKRTFFGLFIVAILLNSYICNPTLMAKGIENFYYDIAEGIGYSIVTFIVGFVCSYFIPTKYRPSKLSQINWALFCSMLVTIFLTLAKYIYK